jgi:hypothetical protein
MKSLTMEVVLHMGTPRVVEENPNYWVTAVSIMKTVTWFVTVI